VPGLEITVIRCVVPTRYDAEAGPDSIDLSGMDIVVVSAPAVSVAGSFPRPLREIRLKPHLM